MEITLNNKYIITRTYTNTTDETTTNKEQVVTITYKEEDADGGDIYKFDYGNVGYHEGYSKLENIRELTNEERGYSDNGEYWKLPQQFYQSIPK